MITVDIYTRTGDNNVDIDHNFRPIHEGEMDPVVFRFHFDDSWATRTTRIVSLINGNKVYTMPLHNDTMTVPVHMLTEGRFFFIVRGYLTTNNLNIVLRDGHLVITDSPKKKDLPAYSYTDRLGGFTITDESNLPHEAWARKKPSEHFVLSDEVVYKETHDVPPVTEEPTGYMEAHNLFNDNWLWIAHKKS